MRHSQEWHDRKWEVSRSIDDYYALDYLNSLIEVQHFVERVERGDISLSNNESPKIHLYTLKEVVRLMNTLTDEELLEVIDELNAHQYRDLRGY